MNKEAIYTVIHNHHDYLFYSEAAGTFQSALEVCDALSEKGAAPHRLSMLTFDPNYPDTIIWDITSNPSKGEPVFDQITKEQAEEYGRRAPRHQPAMEVILDMDIEMMHLLARQENGEATQYTLPMDAALACYEDATVHSGSIEEILTLTFPQAAANWHTVQGHNAVHTIRNGDQELNYYTEYGGSHFNAVAAARKLRLAMKNLHDWGFLPETSDLCEALTYKSPLAGFWEPLGDPFYPSPASDPESYPKALAEGRLALHVVLDMYTEEPTITFYRGKAYNHLPPILTVTLEEAIDCMDKATYQCALEYTDTEKYAKAVEESITKIMEHTAAQKQSSDQSMT